MLFDERDPTAYTPTALLYEGDAILGVSTRSNSQSLGHCLESLDPGNWQLVNIYFSLHMEAWIRIQDYTGLYNTHNTTV